MEASPPVYYLNQTDVENVYTLLSGMVTAQMFTLAFQIMTVGVLLVVVFVISSKRM